MTDAELLELFSARDEAALRFAAEQHGKACRGIAERILGSPQDAEECFNDALMQVWQHIPPAHPESLYAYLAETVRNLAYNRYYASSRQKRGGSLTAIAFEELADCLRAADTTEQHFDERELGRAITAFLDAQPKMQRMVFLQRYWAMMPVKDIAETYHIRENTVKSILRRMRNRLKQYLSQEGLL